MKEDEKFLSSILNWVEGTVSKHFKVSCSKRPLLGWGCFITSLGIYATIVGISSSAEISTQPAALPVATNSSAPAPHTGGADYFVFTDYWKPEQSEAYGVNGQTIFLLPGKERIRFDYVQPVPVGQVFNLTLALGGKSGANFQYGRDGAWELTIGDGDFKTVTVKDCTGNEVVEVFSSTTRPVLGRKLLRDIGFEVQIIEKKIDMETLEIIVKISESELKFKLPLPEKWEEKDDVYFGLLDYSLGENKTSVYWEDPNVTEFINN